MQQTARQAHPADLRLIIVNLTRQLERPTRHRNRRRDRPLPTSSPGSRSTCPEPLTRPRLTGQHRTPRTRIKPVIVGVHCRSRIYRTATQHVSVMIRISSVDRRASPIWQQRPAVSGHQPTVSGLGAVQNVLFVDEGASLASQLPQVRLACRMSSSSCARSCSTAPTLVGQLEAAPPAISA